MYHATKFGVEGFCESVAQEVAQFGIGITIVEPGGARTEFRYGSAHVAKLMPEYESCHQKVRADPPSFAYAHYVAGYGEEARCLVYFFLLLI